MKLIDTHCHLQDERLRDKTEEIIARANTVGVSHMVCCGCCEDDWNAVIALAQRFDCIVPALGIHPWWTKTVSCRWKDRLKSYLERFPQMIVGEIGLDHAIGDRNDDDQMVLFSEQMRIAAEFDRPVSIHCKRAWGSLTSFLRQHPEYASKVVIHSYSGSVELVEELRHYGVMFSYSGSITYPNNRRGTKTAVAVPPDRLLIETDSPDITPYGHDGDNEPANLTTIAETLAGLRGITPEELARMTTLNASCLFGLQATGEK
jgi:TatD DNase family protein